jgi:hypothetical protein
LRRYIEATALDVRARAAYSGRLDADLVVKVGQCRLNLSNPS